MKTMLSLAVLLSMTVQTHAELSCPSLLSDAQVQALNARQDLGSVEIFSREVNGRTQVLTLLGENSLNQALRGPNGEALYDAFDRTGFSFRPNYIRDRIVNGVVHWLGMIAGRVAVAVKKLGGASPRSPVLDINQRELFTMIKDLQSALNEDLTLKTSDQNSSFVNNPYYEVETGRVLLRERPDLAPFLHRRLFQMTDTNSNRLVNLEQGSKARWSELLRDHLPTVNVLSWLTLTTGAYESLPEIAQLPAVLGVVGFWGYQLAANALVRFNAKSWYALAFPYMYAGERGRDGVMVRNAVRTFDDVNVRSLLVIAEQRRIRHLRAQLISAGFVPAASISNPR